MLDVPNNRKFLATSPWTDERIELLKARHAEGLSAGQIAQEFGVTRNTIMGKIHRLKLAAHASGIDRQRVVRKVRANSDRSATQRIGKMVKVRQPSRGGVAMVDTVIRDEGPVPADFLCIALIDLEPQHCRFPRGGDDGEPITFCGQKKLDGESYCLAHHRIAYNAPKPRIERPYLPLGGSRPRVF